MANTQHFMQAVNNMLITSQRVWVSDLCDDLTAMRASIVGITAKLDLDSGVNGTNFASLWDPAALKTVK